MEAQMNCASTASAAVSVHLVATHANPVKRRISRKNKDSIRNDDDVDSLDNPFLLTYPFDFTCVHNKQ
jgi:hypothetical protein